MTELTDRIRTIGERMLGTDTASELLQLRDSCSQQDLARKLTNYKRILDKYVRLCRSLSRKKREELRNQDHNLYLALQLKDHDINNQLQIVLTRIELIPQDGIESVLDNDAAIIAYQNTRIGALTAAYIATRDPRYIVDIRTEDVPQLTEYMIHPSFRDVRVTYDFNGVMLIPSNEYFAIVQMVKNAAAAGCANIHVARSHENGMVISVKDDGPGIDPQMLYRIFDAKKTEIGFSITQALADQVSIVTTLAGRNTLKYDSKLRRQLDIASGREHGTEIKLHFGRGI